MFVTREDSSWVPNPETPKGRTLPYNRTSTTNYKAGQKVYMHGSTSGERPGTITIPSVKTTYAGFNHEDLVLANYFSQSGDSGAPVFAIDGTGAYGQHVGIIPDGALFYKLSNLPSNITISYYTI